MGSSAEKRDFDEDCSQNYLVFQPLLRYLTSNSNWITEWKSQGLSNESLEAFFCFYFYTLTPSINYYGDKVRSRFTGSILQQKAVKYSHKEVANLYVVYEITNSYKISSYRTLENALFGAVKLTKNADIDKCWYFGFGTGFDRHGFFSHPSRGYGRNLIMSIWAYLQKLITWKKMF